MARPLMQHGVGQLEELFAKSKADQKVLKQLENELQYRQVPRAVALLAEVQAVMYGEETPAPPAPAPPPTTAPPEVPPQPELWDRPAQPRVNPTLPPVITAPVAPPALPPTPRPPGTAAPNMPLDDAYKLLRATPSSTWESIEQTRRLLVQASHPEKLKNLAADKRSQALAEALRVNAAYAALSQARCAGR